VSPPSPPSNRKPGSELYLMLVKLERKEDSHTKSKCRKIRKIRAALMNILVFVLYENRKYFRKNIIS
jgi:hypothetical protein